MATPAPTSAPWSVYEHDPLVIVDSEGSSLGEMVPGDPYITAETAQANACMAAAAPELYAALAAFVAPSHPARPAKTRPLIGAALAALAKARGEAA